MLRTGQASMDRRTHEFGFTLVELLVVILIIGILAAIAIPAFMEQRKRANDAAVENDVKNIALAIEAALIAEPNARYVNNVILNDDGSWTASGKDTGSVVVKVGDQFTPEIPLSDGVSVDIWYSQGVNPDGTISSNAAKYGYKIAGWHENGSQYRTGGGNASNFLYHSSLGGGSVELDEYNNPVGQND